MSYIDSSEWPEYDSRRKCAKCGSGDVSTQYHSSMVLHDILHFRCSSILSPADYLQQITAQNICTEDVVAMDIIGSNTLRTLHQ